MFATGSVPFHHATGNPFSQPLGEFHGRTDILSGSLVAQPDRRSIPQQQASESKTGLC